MEEIFKIEVNDKPLYIRVFDLTPEDTQYEVWNDGQLEFTLEYDINKDNPGWKEVGKNVSGSLFRPYIDKIGNEIDSYLE